MSTNEERLARYEHGADILSRFLGGQRERAAPEGGEEAFHARIHQLRDLVRAADPELSALAGETLVAIRELAWPETFLPYEGRIGEKRTARRDTDPLKLALMMRVRELVRERKNLGVSLSFLREELDREQLVRRAGAALMTESQAISAMNENAALRDAVSKLLEFHPLIDARFADAHLIRIFEDAGIEPIFRQAISRTKTDLMSLHGMGPERYRALLDEMRDLGLPAPHLAREDRDIHDEARAFPNLGLAAEVAWDPHGSPLNQALSRRLDEIFLPLRVCEEEK